MLSLSPGLSATWQVYCAGSRSCAGFFFPDAQQAEFAALFRADVRGRCADAAGEGPLGRAHPDYCGGGGNVSCFRAQWSTGVQVPPPTPCCCSAAALLLLRPCGCISHTL
jgi:hypothetical protein